MIVKHKKTLIVNLLISLLCLFDYFIIRDIGHLKWLVGLLLLWWMTLLLQSRYQRAYAAARNSLIAAFFVLLLFLPLSGRISEKSDFNYSHVHDGSLQTEYAAHLLLEGRNIYSENTPQYWFGMGHSRLGFRGFNNEKYFRLNPALFHYIYPPLFIMQSLPAYWLFEMLNADFDQRYILVIYLFLMLWLIIRLPATRAIKELSIFMLLLSPYCLKFFLEGRNDIVIFFWLFLTFFLLHKQKTRSTIFALAIASLMKQTAWPFVPFVCLYLYYYWQPKSMLSYSKRLFSESVVPLLLSFSVMLPFMAWDFQGLWHDVILYPSGKLATSYPVNGFSLVAILMRLGIYGADPAAYYPVWIVQLPVYIMVLLWTAYQLRGKPVVDVLLRQTTIGMALFWFLSRFYHGNYINFTLLLGYLAWLFHVIRKETVTDLLLIPKK